MNVRIEKSLPFIAGFHYQDKLNMNNYNVRLYMLTNSSDAVSQNIALERIKHFIWNEISNTVFINEDNIEQCNLYLQAGMNITTLPAEPVDQIIGMMLYSKLNAIMEDVIVINEIEIASEAGDNIVYLHAADENLGPFEEAGWWVDADLNHGEIVVDNFKVVSMQQTNNWREINLNWPGEEETPKTGNTIVFADFKQTNDPDPIQ
jgi:hypothetical protein